MAFATISMTNGVEIKKVPLGFSWTTFFFGGWVPLIRQDWIVGFILLIVGIITYGIAGIIMAFFYNKIYAKSLFDKGFYIHKLPPGTSEEDVRVALDYVKLPNQPQ